MTRKPALRLSVGTLLLAVAVVGFVIVPEHKPHLAPAPGWWGGPYRVGWSQTAYDAARIGTWALLIVGVILLAVGLIDYARR